MKKSFLYLALLLLCVAFVGLLPVANAQSWAWGRGSSGAACEGWCVATDAFGNVYGGGFNQHSDSVMHFGSLTLPIYTINQDYQSFWVKYNATGTLLWAGCTLSGATCIQSMTCDPSGNLIILGSFTSHNMQIGAFVLTNIYTDGSAQYFLAKISPSGAPVWVINDGNTAPESDLQLGMIGTGKVRTDDSGYIYIASEFKKHTITIGAHTLTNVGTSGGYDVFVAKYTPAGTPVWSSSIGGNSNDYAMGLALTSSGNIYVSGAFWSASVTVGASTITNTSTITPRAFIARFSPAGTPLWANAALTSGETYSCGLVVDNSDDVYMAGSFSGGGINIGSVTTSRVHPASTQPALFLAKFSTADTVDWINVLEGNWSGFRCFSVAWSHCAQRVWVASEGSGIVQESSGDTLGTIASGADPVFLAGYTTSGLPVNFTSLSSGADDEVEIACDAAGDVYLSADIDGSTLRVGPDSVIGLPGGEVYYMAKYQNTALNPDTVFYSRDTSAVCTPGGTILTAPSGYVSYIWDNGATGPTRTITTSGTYWVFSILCTQVRADTFNVIINFDSVYQHTDTIGCSVSDTSYITLIPPSGTNYLWYDGSTDSTHIENRPGAYWVTYISGCNYVTDTFNLTFTNTIPPCPNGVVVGRVSAPEAVTFSPNPASGELVFTTSGTSFTFFTITSGIGTQNLQGRLNAPQTTVEISSLPPGFYYITFTGNNGKLVKKLVKL